MTAGRGLSAFFIVFVLVSSLCGCSVGFSNSRAQIPPNYTNVYVPASVDHSVYGGQSARLSAAVRQMLAMHTNLHIVPLNQARWTLQMRILDRSQQITSVDDCHNPGTPSVASGAYDCNVIHPELTDNNTSLPYAGSQPTVSPSTEELSLVVDVKAIDLNSGAILWSKLYDVRNLPAVGFNEIGDTGDNRTLAYTADTPDLHPLRYQEAVDKAVSDYAHLIADDIGTVLFRDWGLASQNSK